MKLINMIALLKQKHIGGVILCMVASSVVVRGHEPWSGQTKDYEIGMCCLSAKHAIDFILLSLLVKSFDITFFLFYNFSFIASCFVSGKFYRFM